MYQKSETSPKRVLVDDCVRNVPFTSNAGNVLTGERSTRQSVSVRSGRAAVAAAGRAGGGALSRVWYQSCAQYRLVLPHVDVVEALGRHVALVFHQRIIRRPQVREARAPRWLDAFGLGVGNPVERQAKHAARPGQLSLLTNTVRPASPV